MPRDELAGRLPEREQYPIWMSTPQVHEMLGGHIGMKRLRRLAKDQPATFGIRWNGRKPLWSRDRVLHWATHLMGGAQVGWERSVPRRRRSA